MTSPSRDRTHQIAAISPEVRAALNAGTRATTTATESLAIDFATLARHVVPELPEDCAEVLIAAREQGITQRMATVAAILLHELGLDILPRLAEHPADTVRGWACYLIALAPQFKLKARLDRIRPLADDPHPAVRQWAWRAIRPELAKNVPHAIACLEPWTRAPSANLRRFVCEATRPRGVGSHPIEQLKHNPALGLPILEPLRADPAPVVQDSVADWLIDAAKSHPAWVREILTRWQRESPTPATDHICTRAGRNRPRD